MRRFILLILCLFFTGFLFAKNDCAVNKISNSNIEHSFPTLNSLSGVDIHGISFTFVYTDNTGCVQVFNVNLTYDDSNGHIDYSQSYFESGCGNGTRYYYHRVSNYIHDTNGFHVSGTHLRLDKGQGNGLLNDPDFIRQYNKSVELHLNEQKS